MAKNGTAVKELPADMLAQDAAIAASMDLVDATVDPSTFQENEGEWVEPAAGVVVEGLLEKAFLLPDTQGDREYRVAYGIRDTSANGNALWLVGEKGGFKTAIRKLNLGTYVRVEFRGKGEDSKGRQMWLVDFKHARILGKGLKAIDALKTDHARRQKEDVPF